VTETTDLDWARHQLVAIDDELRAVERDDFARRHALQCTADTFRAILRDGHADELAAARSAWTSRAGRKGEHEVDTAVLEGFVAGMKAGPGTGMA